MDFYYGENYRVFLFKQITVYIISIWHLGFLLKSHNNHKGIKSGFYFNKNVVFFQENALFSSFLLFFFLLYDFFNHCFISKFPFEKRISFYKLSVVLYIFWLLILFEWNYLIKILLHIYHFSEKIALRVKFSEFPYDLFQFLFKLCFTSVNWFLEKKLVSFVVVNFDCFKYFQLFIIDC